MMKREYLVEVTKKTRLWVEAADEDAAKELAENIEESDDTDIEYVEVLDEREIEDDDYFGDEDLEEEEW